MMPERLKTLEINVEKGICRVNGKDISQTGEYLELRYENGVWSLVVKETELYVTRDLPENQVKKDFKASVKKIGAEPLAI